jgi:hypothetical protein
MAYDSLVRGSSSMLFSEESSITPEWLASRVYDDQWLARWTGEHWLDEQAVTEWLTIHKHSDPRLNAMAYTPSPMGGTK